MNKNVLFDVNRGVDYMAPEVVVVSVIVEKGYELSGGNNESYDVESGTWD